jgi:hypothetical protein
MEKENISQPEDDLDVLENAMHSAFDDEFAAYKDYRMLQKQISSADDQERLEKLEESRVKWESAQQRLEEVTEAFFAARK